MESLNESKVFEEATAKKEEVQKSEEIREQDAGTKEQIKAEKEEAKKSGSSPLQKLISYIELAGIVVLVGFFRKPLIKLGDTIFKAIEEEEVKITGVLKSAIAGFEVIIRQDIVSSYLLDPIQCYRIGGGLYTQLVDNGNWVNNVYGHLDPIPATVSPSFTVGTGNGASTVRNTLVRGLSIQILGMSEYMIANGRKLST